MFGGRQVGQWNSVTGLTYSLPHQSVSEPVVFANRSLVVTTILVSHTSHTTHAESGQQLMVLSIPGLHIRWVWTRTAEVTHGYTRDLLTYLLTYLNAAALCISSPPPIWPLVSVKWISVNVNMFAIHYLSQIRHSHWYYILIQCSLLSVIGLI